MMFSLGNDASAKRTLSKGSGRSMVQAASRYNFVDIAKGFAKPPPAAQLLGWRFIELDRATSTLRCSFQATEGFLNPAGVIQGGILAAMLDETMGPVTAAVSGDEIFAQTLEIKVSFLGAAYPGEILGEGRVLKRGRDIIFLEGRLTDSAGKVLAVATATARALKDRTS